MKRIQHPSWLLFFFIVDVGVVALLLLSPWLLLVLLPWEPRCIKVVWFLTNCERNEAFVGERVDSNSFAPRWAA